ncbi:MAG: F0F1 ATP synthase subunit gamma, partial [Alphaproteobacteria bacterium]
MPSLKDLRNRIATVTATQKITKAMQMVAAAKLRRAQDAAEAARPYSTRMESVLANIAKSTEGAVGAPALIAGTGKDDVHLLVVCTSERGLCGGFNSSIARLARDHARKLLKAGKTVKIVVVGKKGYDILKREFSTNIIEAMTFREIKSISFTEAGLVGQKVLELFDGGEFDVATLYFSRFQSVMAQIPTAQQIVPAKVETDTSAASDGSDTHGSGLAAYEYEPSEEGILEDLLPRNISVQIFKALLENAASEQGARMSAMDSATRNAGD